MSTTSMHHAHLRFLVLAALALVACSKTEEHEPGAAAARRPTSPVETAPADVAADSDDECDTTWKAIQRSILEGKRCAQAEFST